MNSTPVESSPSSTQKTGFGNETTDAPRNSALTIVSQSPNPSLKNTRYWLLMRWTDDAMTLVRSATMNGMMFLVSADGRKFPQFRVVFRVSMPRSSIRNVSFRFCAVRGNAPDPVLNDT